MHRKKYLLIIFLGLKVCAGLPMDTLTKNVAESNSFDNFDNYIPRYDDLPNYNHPPLQHFKNETHSHSFNTPAQQDDPEIDINTSGDIVVDNITTEVTLTITNEVQSITDAMNNADFGISDINIPIVVTDAISGTKESMPVDTDAVSSTTESVTADLDAIKSTTDVIKAATEDDDESNENFSDSADDKVTDTKDPANNVIRVYVDDANDNEKINTTSDEPKNTTDDIKKTTVPNSSVSPATEFNNTFNINDFDGAVSESTRNPREEAEDKDKSSQEGGSSSEESEEEEEEEEDMNMVTGLLSALLGGLSKPDGGIDLEAIVGLIGSLSTQNDDGTYDFQGLTELLKGFFGGGNGGGGSDIGAFTGGLLGAVIKGIANPPGGKGVGILTAKILGGILPALSVQPPENGKPSLVKPGGLDIGGFLGGFVKTLFGASKGVNPIQFVLSTITSLSNSKPKQPPPNKD